MTRSTAQHPSALYASLFGLVRRHLWLPDGKPPTGWNERREGSVLKRLLCHRTPSQIEVAIIGLALLRERGEIDWLKPGAKVTCRALYHSRSGASQMFELATRAYWANANTRRRDVTPRLGGLGPTLDQLVDAARSR